MRFRPSNAFAFGTRSIIAACIAVLVAMASWPRPALGQSSDYCKSDRHVINDGQVHDVEIVDLVDRDGDGYVSSFVVRVTADSRQSRYRQKGKGWMKALHGLVSSNLPVPLPFTANKRCLDFVPGFEFAVMTADESWIDWGYRHMNDYDDYPGPGTANDRQAFYVGPLENVELERIDALPFLEDAGEGMIVPRRPDDGQLRRAFVNDGDLTNGERRVLKTLQINVCWKPMGRMKAADSDIPKVIGCVDPLDDFGDDITDIARKGIANTLPSTLTLVALDEKFDGGLKMEVPRLDKEAEIEKAEPEPEPRKVEEEPKQARYEPARATLERMTVRTIRGTVINAEDPDHRISRTEIVFEVQGGDATRTTRTSTDGSYSIELPAGEYEVRIDQRLFHPMTTTLTVPEEGDETTADFALRPDREAIEASGRAADQIDQARRIPELGPGAGMERPGPVTGEMPPGEIVDPAQSADEARLAIHPSAEYTSAIANAPGEFSWESFADQLKVQAGGEAGKLDAVRFTAVAIEQGVVAGKRTWMVSPEDGLTAEQRRNVVETGRSWFPGSQWAPARTPWFVPGERGVPGSQWVPAAQGFPGSRWIPGSEWFPGSQWIPGSEVPFPGDESYPGSRWVVFWLAPAEQSRLEQIRVRPFALAFEPSADAVAPDLEIRAPSIEP